MRSRVWLPFALALASSVFGPLAFARHAVAPTSPKARRVAAPKPVEIAPTISEFSQLPALRFNARNTGRHEEVRLYDDEGRVDPGAAARLDALLCDERDPDNPVQVELARRTLQLVVRAALHFRVREVEVVSAYRKPGRRREGPHASGRALDFKLPGVPARTLASYLRQLPRVGVGVYTHPKTAFVHLDTREQSFHWLDASPPGRHWREQSLGNAGLAKRDAAYRPANDWPEGLLPPSG